MYAAPINIQASTAIRGFIAKVNDRSVQEGGRSQMILADNTRENISKDIHEFCLSNGIKIEPSPAYTSESSGMVERLFQDHWTRGRVMMIATNLPAELWDEAVSHASWVRNKLRSFRINFSISLSNGAPKLAFRLSRFQSGEYKALNASIILRTLKQRNCFGDLKAHNSSERKATNE